MIYVCVSLLNLSKICFVYRIERIDMNMIKIYFIFSTILTSYNKKRSFFVIFTSYIWEKHDLCMCISNNNLC